MNENLEKKLIGVSALTASVLEIKKIRSKASSNQAYLLLGSRCQNSCTFCSQGKFAKSSDSLLSRVTWPKYEIKTVLEKLKEKQNDKIKKICFQVVSYPGYFEDFLQILDLFRAELSIPIGASINVSSMDDIDELFGHNLVNLGIAIDASSDSIYKKVKNNKKSFNTTLQLIIKAANNYPSKVTAHIIAGLGETDRDLLNLFSILLSNDANIALFAFTPVKGTELENYPRISIERYRYIQFVLEYLKKKYLLTDKKGNCLEIDKNDLHLETDVNDLRLKTKIKDSYIEMDILNVSNSKNNEISRLYDDFSYISFDMNEMIVSFSSSFLNEPGVLSILDDGEYMETSGCNLCNRPFYNDNPYDKDLYNHHQKPDKEIIQYWKNKILSL
ncbi:MAG: radical SAM protein [Spirochaetes bacterium]|nr:radical SAM protein [Spirochaetota bacterium]